MQTSWMWGAFLGTAVLITGQPAFAWAHRAAPARAGLTGSATTEHPASVLESDWSGPRMGFMFAPGDASIAHRLRDHGLGNVVSQFGWHFEHRVVPLGEGPQLVTEMIPLFGGVEYGKFVPSLTAAMGVRFRSGFELGMGPSFTVASDNGGINKGLVIAVGKSIDYGAVCIPLNLAVSTNPKGTMVTLIAGYAIHQPVR